MTELERLREDVKLLEETNRRICRNWETEVRMLREQLAIARDALDYCSSDDSMAVDPENRFDVGSANEWKKLRAREAVLTIYGPPEPPKQYGVHPFSEILDPYSTSQYPKPQDLEPVRPEVILERISNQARNLLFAHRVGIGNGSVSVSVPVVETMLRTMGALVADQVVEILGACSVCKSKIKGFKS